MAPRERFPRTRQEARPAMAKEEREALKQKIEGGSGRTFEGVHEKMERFSRLEEGKDYHLVSTNARVESDSSVADYMLFINPTKGSERRLISPPHWRAVTTPGVHASLDLGSGRSEPYFEANTKGAGYTKPSAMGISLDEVYDTWITRDKLQLEPYSQKHLGIAGLSSFIGIEGKDTLIDRTNYLIDKGLRTESYWGIAKLDRVIYRGEPMTIDELRERKIITSRKNFEPAMAVRLFKINSRVEEVYRDITRRAQIFKEAFEAFNKEERMRNPEAPKLLSIGNTEDERAFFKTFFERMAANLGVLLNQGYASYALHSSNVTMAAEIADAETFMHSSQDYTLARKKFGGVRQAHIKDMRDVMYGLRFLMMAGKGAGMHTSSREQLYEAFMDSFCRTISRDSLEEEGTDPEKAIEWMSKIAKTVTVERENLPSLMHHTLKDWPIKVE